MPPSLKIKNHHQETHLFNSRAIFAAIGILLLVLVLLLRLAYLQIVQHHFYSTLSKKNMLMIVPIQPNRGLIYDRNGILLAKNIPTYNLDVIPGKIKNLNKTIKALQEFLPITAADLKTFRREVYQHRPFEPIAIKTNLTEEQLAAFYVNQYRFTGLIIEPQMMRFYPMNKALTSVLGYVGRINQTELAKINNSNYSGSDFIGKVGIEKYYENQLHGTVGYEEAEINANGHIIRILDKIPPVPGNKLYLTIDSRLQKAAIDALGDFNGAVVAIQPSTGQVLAMVSKPSYDPNAFVQGISQQDYLALVNSPDHPLYNRAIRGLFAPGSTIKPYYALKALNENLITPEYRVYDNGIFYLPNSSHAYHDWRTHGWVDVIRAITVSCDIFFYNVATRVGIERMDDMFDAFGFGQKTGIDLPAELPGIAPSPDWKRAFQGQPWYPGDTLITGIGQGSLLVTPLQMAVNVSAIAEHGKRFRPHVLLYSVSPTGLVIPQHDMPLTPVNFSEAVWNTVIKGMQSVVTSPEGTAYYYFVRGFKYTAAGKTGTAEMYGKRGQDEKLSSTPKNLRNNHLFVVFSPVENPQIALAIVLEHGGKGDNVRIARELLDFYYKEQTQGSSATANNNSSPLQASDDPQDEKILSDVNLEARPDENKGKAQ